MIWYDDLNEYSNDVPLIVNRETPISKNVVVQTYIDNSIIVIVLSLM